MSTVSPIRSEPAATSAIASGFCNVGDMTLDVTQPSVPLGSVDPRGSRWAPIGIIPPPSMTSSPTSWRRSLRSEEHTSELQSLMRISYAVFCLKKKKPHISTDSSNQHIVATSDQLTTLHTCHHHSTPANCTIRNR